MLCSVIDNRDDDNKDDDDYEEDQKEDVISKRYLLFFHTLA